MHKFSRRQTVASILAAGASAAVPSTLAARDDGSAVHVSFLLVNDIYRIEEKDGRGGMARFAAVVKAERARALAENCHLICVHAGDTLSPSSLSSFDQGAHMVDLFNDVGLDAFVPGNHEFDFGKEAYFNRVSQARFPLAPPMKQRRAPRVPAILPSRRRYRWSLPTPKARARRGPIW